MSEGWHQKLDPFGLPGVSHEPSFYYSSTVNVWDEEGTDTFRTLRSRDEVARRFGTNVWGK